MSATPTTWPEPEARTDELVRLRRSKMARSAHAYVRGSTTRFYEWLEASNGSLPDGPPIWICGDCHVGNLGPLADAEGAVEVQIRDLDQTVVGNPAHDLTRLGLSLASAARGSDLPGVTTAHMLEEMIAGYVAGLAEPTDGEAASAKRPKIVRRLLRNAASRRWRHLAQERIEGVKPEIPLGSRFWALSARERDDLAALFSNEEVVLRVAALTEGPGEPIELVDAAYWVKGCSSLGRLRYAVLLRVGKGGQHGLFDIKESAQAAAPRHPRARMPRENAERIVAGARALSPNLGERMVAARLGDRSVVVRELMPQDLKIEADRLTRDEAVSIARYLAGVVGQAHGRQLDAGAREAWRTELTRDRSKTLDAPSWLWTSVVELAGLHERAYLEHCRRYAMG